MHHFIVTGQRLVERVISNGPKQKVKTTFRLGVCCRDINDALRLTRTRYGEDCEIMNVTHQGVLDVLETL